MKSTLFFWLKGNELRNSIYKSFTLSQLEFSIYLKATILFKNEKWKDTLYVKFYFYAIMVSSEYLIFSHRNRY